MTQAEYFAILKEKWEQVDKDNLEAIRAYNKFKQLLRHQLDEEGFPPHVLLQDRDLDGGEILHDRGRHDDPCGIEVGKLFLRLSRRHCP